MKKGFTLIELLVVIAIIGILSSVVLASVNVAREKGRDASIKSNLSSLRAQAEIVYDEAGYYGSSDFVESSCDADPTGTLFEDEKVQEFLLAAGNASSATGLAGANCVSTDVAWAVAVPMVSDPANSWCVDSQGASKQVTPDVTYPLGFNGTDCM